MHDFGKKAKEMQRACVMCRDTIRLSSSSFEQRLIDDKDFCRKCWDGITGAVYPKGNIFFSLVPSAMKKEV